MLITKYSLAQNKRLLQVFFNLLFCDEFFVSIILIMLVFLIKFY